MCKVYPTALSGSARTWYKKLPSRSIRDFTTYASKFVLHFQGAKPPTKDLSSLQYIKQKRQEPLHEYMKRYHDEVMQMKVYEESKTLRNFWYNLHTGPLWVSFEERPPTSYGEAYDCGMKKIFFEEKRNIKREREKAEDFSEKKKDKKKQDVRPSRPVPPQQWPIPPQQDSQRASLPYKCPPQPTPETPRPQPSPQLRNVSHWPKRESATTHAYHPLNTIREQVFYAIRDKGLLTRPPKLITPLAKRNLKSDMQGISPNIISHRLNVDPIHQPVRQKQRVFNQERYDTIEEEVDKLLHAGFINEAKYLDWVSNVVLVRKPNEKWCICVDFTNLNKACPKDSFPLPRIDQLVDVTAGHELLSFMDAFSSYNQVKMYTSDEEETSFITNNGLYCYMVNDEYQTKEGNMIAYLRKAKDLVGQFKQVRLQQVSREKNFKADMLSRLASHQKLPYQA
ncbi:Transposon Ty3-G Gag-Pol polyprotein [Melia azedarach]|uniref:Transposon Ty3-G Gag-Pol polyprotein n=1 Tax=Melia azedarach TaxID=155640 RepID=A0ACC1Y1S3_MELAZ|nr:Transposon Ty3-G Gag-Pol polyprotein [Melia azedarach]